MTERRAAYHVADTSAEDMLALLMAAEGLPAPVRQYKFCPKRRWLADFAWPDARLIVEVDGGIWTGGGHTSGSGRTRDMERDNWCTLNGWRVLRFTTGQAKNGEAIHTIREALAC